VLCRYSRQTETGIWRATAHVFDVKRCAKRVSMVLVHAPTHTMWEKILEHMFYAWDFENKCKTETDQVPTIEVRLAVVWNRYRKNDGFPPFSKDSCEYVFIFVGFIVAVNYWSV
jgi:hypothetical protein